MQPSPTCIWTDWLLRQQSYLALVDKMVFKTFFTSFIRNKNAVCVTGSLFAATGIIKSGYLDENGSNSEGSINRYFN